MNRNKDWTAKEIAVIKNENLTHNEAAHRLGRSYSSVKAKRQMLGISVEKKDIDYYTPEALQIIIKNRHLSNSEIAKMLGRTVKAVSLKRQRLGLAPPSKLSKLWDSEEIEYLLENYFNLPKKQIADYLGRSINSVLTKAYEIGITKKTQSWNKTEINILISNFELSTQSLSMLINKSENQIAYKKAYINMHRKKDLTNISGLDSGVPFPLKAKRWHYLELISAMNIGHSFEYPTADNQYIVMARAFHQDRIFKTKKVDVKIRRVWRIL